jgi:hypothetical protein
VTSVLNRLEPLRHVGADLLSVADFEGAVSRVRVNGTAVRLRLVSWVRFPAAPLDALKLTSLKNGCDQGAQPMIPRGTTPAPGPAARCRDRHQGQSVVGGRDHHSAGSDD